MYPPKNTFFCLLNELLSLIHGPVTHLSDNLPWIPLTRPHPRTISCATIAKCRWRAFEVGRRWSKLNTNTYRFFLIGSFKQVSSKSFSFDFSQGYVESFLQSRAAVFIHRKVSTLNTINQKQPFRTANIQKARIIQTKSSSLVWFALINVNQSTPLTCTRNLKMTFTRLHLSSLSILCAV